jgi:hypothetical protein
MERAREALALFQEFANQAGAAHCVAVLAGCVAAQDQTARAATLFGAVVGLLQRADARLDPLLQAAYERDLDAAQARLGPNLWRAAWEIGGEMSLDAIMAFASAPEPGLAPPRPMRPSRRATGARHSANR